MHALGVSTKLGGFFKYFKYSVVYLLVLGGGVCVPVSISLQAGEVPMNPILAAKGPDIVGVLFVWEHFL